jgi:hypothetical protein
VTRPAQIHDWVFRCAGWLLVIVWCGFFGALGLAGHLTTFLVGSSLDEPGGQIHLDGFVNVVLGAGCIAFAVWAARRALRPS